MSSDGIGLLVNTLAGIDMGALWLYLFEDVSVLTAAPGSGWNGCTSQPRQPQGRLPQLSFPTPDLLSSFFLSHFFFYTSRSSTALATALN